MPSESSQLVLQNWLQTFSDIFYSFRARAQNTSEIGLFTNGGQMKRPHLLAH